MENKPLSPLHAVIELLLTGYLSSLFVLVSIAVVRITPISRFFFLPPISVMPLVLSFLAVCFLASIGAFSNKLVVYCNNGEMPVGSWPIRRWGYLSNNHYDMVQHPGACAVRENTKLAFLGDIIYFSWDAVAISIGDILFGLAPCFGIVFNVSYLLWVVLV
ncbi:MAG: DUF5317 family protein [Candidatus Liptonbacteria bacterium]|nr:DUF5317 family protein [Candidatus Liptonbacteria bacterium]